ncbi:MAG: immunity 26/phosphotriesterase HocA family protein [Anaerolineales bacterium]|jgi:hypothetical protein
MKKNNIHYSEGQWFAVPLRQDGYALGIIVRGSYKTKGGLGYFFGPKYEEVPGDRATWEKHPREALLIARFGDLGIVRGSWPLIQSTRPFSEEEWPIPKFGMEVPLPPGKGFIREYEQDSSGALICIRQTPVDADKIQKFPKDTVMGGGAVEIKLTKLLDEH